MLELHLPWLELTIITPLIGVVIASLLPTAEQRRRVAISCSGLALLFAIGAWEDFNTLKVFEAHDRWDLVANLFGPDFLVIDEFGAPLITLTALLFFLVSLGTLRTKVERFPFKLNLVSESLMLATLACRSPWAIIVLMALQTLPVIWEIQHRGRSARAVMIHMVAFIVLISAGWILVSSSPVDNPSILGVSLLTLAILIRSGCAPLHGWMTDMFEKATLGSALLFVAPMIGAYAAVRLLLPIAPDWALQTVALASLFTAVYAGGMALVQDDARRFFCNLVLSNGSLVLVGLEVVTPIGLTGALSTWLAVCLSLTGFGLTLRAIESRVGRKSLQEFHGLYASMPILASFFLLTGLATVGFPGTVGFAGVELIIEGAVTTFPYVGMAVVVATALNGIAIMRAYFRLFTGVRFQSNFSMEARWPERVAVLVISFLIIAGGVWPQPGVQSRYHAANEIMARRSSAARAMLGPPIQSTAQVASDSSASAEQSTGSTE